MKTRFLLLTVLLLATRLIAADAEKQARRAAAGKATAKVARTAGMGGFEQVLTDEQRKEFREQMRASGEKLRASQQEVMKARRELQETVLSGKADEAAIRQRSEAIAKLESEVLAARMSALAKVAGTLTPEQKEKIKELSEPSRAVRPGLGAGRREGDAPRTPREPAAPPPPEK